jgi:hypothetical protein
MKYSVSKILLWIAATIMILINYLAMFRNTNIGRPIFILYTIVAIFSREKALYGVCSILQSLEANEDLISIASRLKPILPMPPPGASEIVTNR